MTTVFRKFDNWIYNRNKAFQSFNYGWIVQCYERFGFEPPENTPDLWLYVAKTVLGMSDKASPTARREAKNILAELNEPEDMKSER